MVRSTDAALPQGGGIVIVSMHNATKGQDPQSLAFWSCWGQHGMSSAIACISPAAAAICDAAIADADKGDAMSAAATASAISQLMTFLGPIPPSLTTGWPTQIVGSSRFRQKWGLIARTGVADAILTLAVGFLIAACSDRSS
ncbi:hypothetical protein [Bradyrhizobium guangzhouense]|uniref:hypothetical protein n=1 Tax=Bradyrhizobium guangzhouense TaxID=1325095 RepID=UPI0013E8A3B8|nr:hypothetical protein [Bradyrhizobium guangzhouense]